jgi:hypothetical protein
MQDFTYQRIGRRGVALALGILLAVGLPSVARAGAPDADRIAELQQKLEQSLKLIAELTARVQHLEAGQANVTPPSAAAAPAPAPAADPQRLEAVEAKVAQIESASARRLGDDSGLAMHGFADVGAGSRNPFNDALKGFNIGNLDFYLTPRLGDRTVTLFELVFEASNDGSVSVDLERAQVGYVFGDAATAWVGRFHTPYGYTNTAMHHGAWVNDALRRPSFLQFEDHGGVLPAHTVGVWLTGALHGADGGKVLYDAYVGNGQQIIGGELDMRSGGNDHGKAIFGGRLGYQWTDGAADGLTLGVHAFSAGIDDDALVQNRTRVNMYGGYAVYDTDRWEHIAEFYLFDDEDVSGASGRHRSSAGFVQLGYRAPWGVPYARYERTSFDQSDNYFGAQATGFSYGRGALGVRYDLDLKSALKLELARTHVTDRTISWVDEILAQYAIRF